MENLSFEEKFRFFILRCRQGNRFFPLEDTGALLDELIRNYSKESELKNGQRLYRARIHDTLENYRLFEPLDYKSADPPKSQKNIFKSGHIPIKFFNKDVSRFKIRGDHHERIFCWAAGCVDFSVIEHRRIFFTAVYRGVGIFFKVADRRCSVDFCGMAAGQGNVMGDR